MYIYAKYDVDMVVTGYLIDNNGIFVLQRSIEEGDETFSLWGKLVEERGKMRMCFSCFLYDILWRSVFVRYIKTTNINYSAKHTPPLTRKEKAATI